MQPGPGPAHSRLDAGADELLVRGARAHGLDIGIKEILHRPGVDTADRVPHPRAEGLELCIDLLKGMGGGGGG